MKKIVLKVILVLYLIISITVTVFIFNFDDHMTTKLGETYLVNITKDIEGCNKNDLLITPTNNNLNIGDKIYYFKTKKGVSHVEVGSVKEVSSLVNNESEFYLNNNETVKSKNVLGKVEESKRVSCIGGLLEVLESKWGYLFLIVLPILLIFAYEVFTISKELKQRKKTKK